MTCGLFVWATVISVITAMRSPGISGLPGAGRVVKQALPPAALELARQAKQALPPTRCLAVDMVQDIRSGQFYIIECSIFINVLSSVQLMVEGVPGRYIEQEGQFVFAPGPNFGCRN